MAAVRAETPSYHVPVWEGETAHLEAVFTDLIEGGAVDPGTLHFTLKAPDETLTTYAYGTDEELVRKVAGVFYVEPVLDQAGVYRYRFEAIGAHSGVCEGMVVVKRSGVATE